MAIQDRDRNPFIELVMGESQLIKDIAAFAFALGHEEGWWLARTDPDTTVSPVEHSTKTNPFITDPQDVDTKDEPASPLSETVLAVTRKSTKPCTCGARKTREACTCPHLHVHANANPQHLGTCNKCEHTYLLGTLCGTADHYQCG